MKDCMYQGCERPGVVRLELSSGGRDHVAFYCQQDMPTIRRVFKNARVQIRAEAPTCRYPKCGSAGVERNHSGFIMCRPHARGRVPR